MSFGHNSTFTLTVRLGTYSINECDNLSSSQSESIAI